METAKEFGWEVMANLKRMEKDFEKNPVLKKLYEKIGDELKKLPNKDLGEKKEFKIKCRFINKILDEIQGE